MDLAAVGEDGVDGQHVVGHDPVAQRAAAGAVVAGHAADGGAARRRGIDGEMQAVRLEELVQVVEHDARLDGDGPVLGRELEDRVEILGGVDDQGLADGLAVLRRAAAAGQDRDFRFVADGDDPPEVVLGSGDGHTDGFDLVGRGIGAVAAAREGIEQDFARDLAPQPGGQCLVTDLDVMPSHAGAQHNLCSGDTERLLSSPVILNTKNRKWNRKQEGSRNGFLKH